MRPELSKELKEAAFVLVMDKKKSPYLKTEKGKLFAQANRLFIDNSDGHLELRFYHDQVLLFTYHSPVPMMPEDGTAELVAMPDNPLAFFCRLEVG
jgi:hypothetical protein